MDQKSNGGKWRLKKQSQLQIGSSRSRRSLASRRSKSVKSGLSVNHKDEGEKHPYDKIFSKKVTTKI